jgi:hypothetical protein
MTDAADKESLNKAKHKHAAPSNFMSCDASMQLIYFISFSGLA